MNFLVNRLKQSSYTQHIDPQNIILMYIYDKSRFYYPQLKTRGPLLHNQMTLKRINSNSQNYDSLTVDSGGFYDMIIKLFI